MRLRVQRLGFGDLRGVSASACVTVPVFDSFGNFVLNGKAESITLNISFGNGNERNGTLKVP